MILISRRKNKKIAFQTREKKEYTCMLFKKRHNMTTVVIYFLSLGALPRHDC